MDGIIFQGVNYRHAVFTVPEQLRSLFMQSTALLGEMAGAAVATLEKVMSKAAGRPLQIGATGIIQTAGRSSGCNPHTHVMSTSGGIDKDGKWVEINHISYDYLHREWQRQLFAMLRERVGGRELNALLDRLEQEYPRGIVAYWEPEPVKTAKGLAKYQIRGFSPYSGVKDHRVRRQRSIVLLAGP